QSSYTLGILTGAHLADRAVRPDELPLRRLIIRALPGRTNREDSALALDHPLAHVAGVLAHQRDPAEALYLLTHPLGTDAGLPEAAARHHEPVAPIAVRRDLVRAGLPPLPAPSEDRLLLVRQRAQIRLPHLRRQLREHLQRRQAR